MVYTLPPPQEFLHTQGLPHKVLHARQGTRASRLFVRARLLFALPPTSPRACEWCTMHAPYLLVRPIPIAPNLILGLVESS